MTTVRVPVLRVPVDEQRISVASGWRYVAECALFLSLSMVVAFLSRRVADFEMSSRNDLFSRRRRPDTKLLGPHACH